MVYYLFYTLENGIQDTKIFTQNRTALSKEIRKYLDKMCYSSVDRRLRNINAEITKCKTERTGYVKYDNMVIALSKI